MAASSRFHQGSGPAAETATLVPQPSAFAKAAEKEILPSVQSSALDARLYMVGHPVARPGSRQALQELRVPKAKVAPGSNAAAAFLPNTTGFDLHVSGHAATIVSPLQTAIRTFHDACQERAAHADLEEWSSSDNDGGHAHDGNGFDYRAFRLHEQRRTAGAGPSTRLSVNIASRSESSRRRRRHMPEYLEPGDDLDDVVGPWNESGMTSRVTQSRSSQTMPKFVRAGGRKSAIMLSGSSLAPRDVLSSIEENLHSVEEALATFYGWPRGIKDAIWRGHPARNLLVVSDIAWAHRHYKGHLNDPPMFWTRGGRVYDLHGDRGTIAEFVNDLISRRVEDDAACRQRRREQGLMPFPFVALPIKHSEVSEALETKNEPKATQLRAGAGLSR